MNEIVRIEIPPGPIPFHRGHFCHRCKQVQAKVVRRYFADDSSVEEFSCPCGWATETRCVVAASKGEKAP